MKFAEKLRKEREALGLLQKEMAAKLNLPTNTYNGYETGKRKPSLEVTAQIAETLGVSIDYLAGITDDKSKVVKEQDASHNLFKNAQDAMEYILKQPVLMNYGVPNLTDEEVIEFANDLLKIMGALGTKYKK